MRRRSEKIDAEIDKLAGIAAEANIVIAIHKLNGGFSVSSNGKMRGGYCSMLRPTADGGNYAASVPKANIA